MNKYTTAFILGNPRSGTSLFRLMLQNNAAIIAPPECGFSQWWLPAYHNWAVADLETERVSTFADDVLKSKKIELWKLEKPDLVSCIHKEKPANYSELVQCVYLCYQKNYAHITAIADKNNYYIHHLTTLPQIWPDARYIHLIRDGRDVACSYLEISTLQTHSQYKPQLPVAIQDIATEWQSNNINVMNYLQQGRHETLQIRYEDLLQHTRPTLEKVCAFLEVPFDASMLYYYRSHNAQDIEPSETLDWKKKTLEQPDVQRIGRYRTDLDKEAIDTFNSIAGKTLTLFGYQL